MNWAILSPCLIVLGALLLIGLERLFPYDRSQRLLRKGFWTDLIGYGLVQSYLLGLCISAIIVWLDRQTGLSRLRLVSDWPLLAQVAFFLVAHDFYIYWFHRLQHHSHLLWRTHEAHHSGDDVDWLSGTRSHSLEIVINQTIEFAPIALLGGAPELPLIKATLDALWGMYIHSNVDVRSGRLQYVINGPEMHRWHHARDLAPPGKNFSTKLAIWDWLFGTAHRPASKPTRYGYDEEGYPRSGPWAWFAQHAYAFRRPRGWRCASAAPTRPGPAARNPNRSDRPTPQAYPTVPVEPGKRAAARPIRISPCNTRRRLKSSPTARAR